MSFPHWFQRGNSVSGCDGAQKKSNVTSRWLTCLYSFNPITFIFALRSIFGLHQLLNALLCSLPGFCLIWGIWAVIKKSLQLLFDIILDASRQIRPLLLFKLKLAIDFNVGSFSSSTCKLVGVVTIFAMIDSIKHGGCIRDVSHRFLKSSYGWLVSRLCPFLDPSHHTELHNGSSETCDCHGYSVCD